MFKHGRFPHIPHEPRRVHMCQMGRPFYQNPFSNNYLHTPSPLSHTLRYQPAAAEFRNFSAYPAYTPDTPILRRETERL